MQWTLGRLAEDGATLRLAVGDWGDGTTADDRYAVTMIHRQQEDGSPSLMVIDALPIENLANIGLRRDEVIGTALAAEVFAIADAIYEQDGRFFF